MVTDDCVAWQREFMMHAERYASQLRAAVGQLHEQHERSLQRRTEVGHAVAGVWVAFFD